MPSVGSVPKYPNIYLGEIYFIIKEHIEANNPRLNPWIILPISSDSNVVIWTSILPTKLNDAVKISKNLYRIISYLLDNFY